MTPFDRSHTSFYCRSVVTMALSCIISEIKRDITRWSRHFHTPPALDAPVMGPRCKIAITFGIENLEWWVYQTVKEVWEYDNTFWHNTRKRQTPSQTPRHHMIARAALCSLARCSRAAKMRKVSYSCRQCQVKPLIQHHDDINPLDSKDNCRRAPRWSSVSIFVCYFCWRYCEKSPVCQYWLLCIPRMY